MYLSLIIPTLNEEKNVFELLNHLSDVPDIDQVEILVCDGQSQDRTAAVCANMNIPVVECERGRAVQMNKGARQAKGDVLYFVHADTRPPLSFVRDIRLALEEGYDMGSYRFRFDSANKLLKINNFFTRFNKMWTRGGDQSLFITREVFELLGGYREEFVIMEEYDLLRRAKGQDFRFKILPGDILVSARKYEGNSYLKVQFANLVVFNMFRLGYEPKRILKTYRRLIDYRS